MDNESVPDEPMDYPGMLIPGQFDSGWGTPPMPELSQPLETAAAIAKGLAGKIQSASSLTLANAAGTTDRLIDKIFVPIKQSLGNAAVTLQSLQQPIMTDLAGRLGSVMESAAKLGVVPPTPGGETTMPAFVQVRQSALAGDLGPALEQYRLTAAPYAGFGGLQYGQAMQAITSALPADPVIQDAFAKAVAAGGTPAPIYIPPSPAPMQDYAACVANASEAYQKALRDCQITTGGLAPDVNTCNLAAYNAVVAAMAACNALPDAPGNTGSTGGASAPAPAGAGGGPGGILRPKPRTPPQLPGTIGPPPPGRPAGPLTGDIVIPIPAGPGKAPSPVPPIIIPPPPPVVIPPPDTGGSGPAGSGPAGDTGNSQPPLPGNVGPAPAPPGLGVQPGPLGDGGTGTQAPAPPGLGVQPGVAPPPDAVIPPPTSPGVSVPPVYVANAGDCPIGTTPVATGTPGVWQCTPNPPPPADLTPDQVAGGCVPIPGYGTMPPLVTCPVGYHVPPSTPTTPQVSSVPPPPPPPPPPDEESTVGVGAAAIADEGIAGCDEFPDAPGVQMPEFFGSLAEFLTIKNKDGSINVGSGKGDQWGIRDAVVGAFGGVLASLLDTVGGTLNEMLKSGACIDDQQMSLIFASVVTGLANRWLGTDVKEMRVPNEQQRNYRCPTALPSAPDAAIAWMGDQIGDDTLECWVRAAGVRFPEYKKVIDAMRAKFPLMQLGSLYLRGQLTEDMLQERIRESGYTRDADVDDLVELLKMIPPPSDLVRFMVRDTADEGLASKFGMDDDFQVKFAGKITEWAKASGVSDEYMQSVWRAHWSIPSPGQLMDMLHRSAELPVTDPAYTDLEDVETALRQQDILPYWIPKLLNTAYNQLGRIDLRRGYQLGVIDDEKLVEKYQVAGYREDDANTLAAVTRSATLATFKRSPIVSRYANGLLSDDEFTQLLTDDGATQEIIDGCKERALVISSQLKRKRCTDAYHKRFLIGDLSAADLQGNLLGLGISAGIADNIISGWQCEASAIGKALPASELAGLYGQGVITISGLTERLQRLGYKYEDAVLLARRVATNTQQKIDKQSAADLKRQAQDDARQQKADAAQQKRDAAALQRNANKADALTRVNTLRQKRLIESGGKFGTSAGLDLSTATAIVSGVYRAALSQGQWLPDEIIAALVTASSLKTITTADQLSAAVFGALNND